MSNHVVERIDLGKVIINKNFNGRWDFYQKEDTGNNFQRLTRDEFESVEVVGDVVYARKKNKRGEEVLGIYDFNGWVKLYPKKVIDCGETFLGQNSLDYSWDFYTKQGERITDEEFSAVEVFGNLIRVARTDILSFEVGIYNSKGEEVLPVKYRENMFIVADEDKNPVCIADRVYYNRWKFYNPDGTTLTELEDVFIEQIEVVDVETENLTKYRYLKTTEKFGKLGLYELCGGKLITIVSPYDGYEIYEDDIEYLKTGFRMKKDGKLYYYSFDSKRIIDIT